MTESVSADAWRVEMMRLTAFPVSGPPIDAAFVRDWWPKLFSTPPEKVTQDLKIGVTQLQGRVNDAFMVAVQNPVSFELRRLADDPEQSPPEQDDISPYAAAVPAFQDLALRWIGLENCPPLRRMAFGAILLQPVDSYENGCAILNEHLSNVKVHPDSLDFLYQINRRRASSAIDGLLLNRLSQWTIQHLQQIAISPDGTPANKSEAFACRMELDMNSVPSNELLPKDRLPNLFKELVDMAGEIANKGYAP